MSSQIVGSWGNVIRAEHSIFSLAHRHSPFPNIPAELNVLPYGNGRSYGDSCLNAGNALIRTQQLDRFIEFDAQSGILACESGMLLDEILRFVVPRGWFIPVTPGTRFVTLGGALANDVHGKNHHGAGTFVRHVIEFELLRSDGERLLCSHRNNADWLAATAGGLGLTGLITWMRLQLRPISGPMMDVETIRYANIDQFIELCAESDRDFEYTVAWIDCLGRGKNLGRGILQRANHAAATEHTRKAPARSSSVPITPPFSFVNGLSVRAFNVAKYRGQLHARRRHLEHFESFFYPLDGIRHWNRLYGPRGLYQYQCLIPRAVARDGTAALLDAVARSGQGSFLAVLKAFGNTPSPGMLSFPREGITLAIDFPSRGERLNQLFLSLDAIVAEAGGRLYPAKDGRMPGMLFRSGFPRWSEFARYIDPRSSSSFWRRVTGDA